MRGSYRRIGAHLGLGLAMATLVTTLAEAQNRPGRGSRTRLMTPSPVVIDDGSGVAPGAGGIAGAFTYSTGFEGSEGFDPGWLDDQPGGCIATGPGPNPVGTVETVCWHVTTLHADMTPTDQPQVSTVNPADGTQHVRFTQDPLIPPATSTANLHPRAFGPRDDNGPAGPYTVSFDFFVSAAGGAEIYIIPQAPTQGFLITYMVLGADGNIYVVDDSGGTAVFVAAGTYTYGVYHNLTATLNLVSPLAGEGSIDYSLDGIKIFTASQWTDATRVEQVVLLTDNFNALSTADIDNLLYMAGVPVPCAADVNGDGIVDVNDLLEMIGAWGSADPDADLTDDGVVDVNDLLALIGGWGCGL